MNWLLGNKNRKKKGFGGLRSSKNDWSETESKRAISQGNLQHAIDTARETQHFEESLEDLEEQAENANFSDIETQSFEQELNKIARSEGYENIDDYEGLDDYESAEDLARRRRVVRRMGANKGRRGSLFAAKRLGKKGLTGKMKGIRGTLTMTVTRVTYNIPLDLQCQLFNALDNTIGNQLVNKYITPGVNFLGSVVNPVNGAITFTYQSQANPLLQDTVVIQTQEVPYNLFLNAMIAGDMFQVGGGPNHKPGGQCSLSDSAQANIQWTKQWFFTHRNSLGKGSDNPLIGGMFIDAAQFQLQYQNILIGFPVDKERGLIFTASFIPGYQLGQQLTATFFWNFSVVHLHNFEHRRRNTR